MIDYKSELNDQQYKVVTQGDGPCLVLAGAGSGKTRTITYRVAYLLEKGIAPQNILLLTFTNKAANEMVSRVEQLIGNKPEGIWGGTFHKFGHKLMRMYADTLGYKKGFTIADASDAKELIKICIKEEGMKGVRGFPGPGTCGNIISFAQNAQISIDEVLDWKYQQYEAYAPHFQNIAERYRDKKMTAQVMDFDDLLFNVIKLFEHNDSLREKYAKQFEYILVDEYQDTNVLQARMIDLLAPPQNNILVVGDDAQSIYSFRAADIQNILEFEKKYKDAQIFKLEINYRSTPEILALSNESIGNNKKQYAKELSAVNEQGEKPELTTYADTAQEASQIGRHIRDLIDSGLPRSEIAILFRASAHSQEVEMELVKRDIPYDYRGGQRFFERSHVKDVLAYLRLAHNPKDSIAWMRVLSMYDGIGTITAQKIITRVVEFPGLASLNVDAVAEGLNARSNVGWQKFAGDANRLRQAKGGGPSQLIRAVIAGHYKDMLDKEYENAKERIEDIEQMATFAERINDLGFFLGEATLAEQHSNKLNEKEKVPKVVLSTIHQSKGLEWDAVFVLRVAAGQFPSEYAIIDEADLEEERRLFYVASTRARKQLYYSYPLMMGNDNPYLLQPSPFISELPESVFKEVDNDDYQLVDAESPNYGEDGEKPHWAREFLKSIDDYQ